MQFHFSAIFREPCRQCGLMVQCSRKKKAGAVSLVAVNRCNIQNQARSEVKITFDSLDVVSFILHLRKTKLEYPGLKLKNKIEVFTFIMIFLFTFLFLLYKWHFLAFKVNIGTYILGQKRPLALLCLSLCISDDS